MDWKVTTLPATEPISLAEAKLHLKVENTTDDSLIMSLIKTAREWCEMFQNRAYIEQTITVYLDDFKDIIQLPRPPLIEVDTVKYYDTDGVLQLLDSSYYEIHIECDPAEIRLAYNKSWPTVRDIHNAVQIAFKAGYTEAASGKTITDATEANPCVITSAAHGFITGQSVYISDIIDNGPGGDMEEALNNKTFTITWLSADTFSIPIDLSAKTNTYVSAGTVTVDMLVPDRVKAAIKLLVGHLYEHREAATELTLKETPFAVKSLLSIDRNF